MSQHGVMITDESFRIAVRMGHTQPCIEHRCHRIDGGAGGRRYSWLPHAWSIEWRMNHCPWCGNSPADGLQASFWFLKEGGP